jgi:hypothetical protein
MNLCHKLEIHPLGTCNVMIFAAGAVEWSANDINVDMYTFSDVFLSEEDAEIETARVAAERAEIDARRGYATEEK